jgi:deoxyribose-phosphate aldolase
MRAQGTNTTIALRALVCLDLTNLEDNCTEADIDALCARAQTRHGSTAAVCIWPQFVSRATAALKGTGIKVATVVNFPSGEAAIEDVIAMTERAVADGADEIDMVVPYGEALAGNPAAVEESVAAVREVFPGIALKAILETGKLKSPHLIRDAAERALRGGADFLKTSTGKVAVNATPEAAEVMLTAIRTHGGNAGFKAAGGVRSLEDAGVYLDLCDRIMGAGWAGPKHFRIGASGLLDALLAALQGSDTSITGDDDD